MEEECVICEQKSVGLILCEGNYVHFNCYEETRKNKCKLCEEHTEKYDRIMDWEGCFHSHCYEIFTDKKCSHCGGDDASEIFDGEMYHPTCLF